MEFKGTKGEWRFVEYVDVFNGDGYEIQFGEDGECITDHVYELEDAKLIAAAPELLRVLIMLKGCLDDDISLIKNDPCHKQINEAINKAL